MTRLKTLKPRVSTIAISRLQPLQPVNSPRHGSAGLRKTGRRGMEDRERIRRRDKGLCQEHLKRGMLILGTQVDHVIPLSAGGPDTDENKQLLCDECHKEKSRAECAGGRG